MSEMNRPTIGKLLKAFGDSLHAMDDRELDLLLQGKGMLSFTPAPRTGDRPETDARVLEAAREAARRLTKVDSREAAREVLASINHPRRREFLLLIAQASSIRVGSRDSVARIEQKLIQAIVGSKLRTRAFKEVAF